MIIILAGKKRKQKNEGKENGMSCRHDKDCKYGHCSVCPLNGLLNHKACGIAKGRPCISNNDCCNHRSGGLCVKNECRMAVDGTKILNSILS